MTNIYPASLPKRVVSFFIDLGILYIIGLILIIALGDIILTIGNFKILIGILISTLYFTILHSKVAKGQTIGKKIFGFKVVKLNGEYLNLPESFLRSIIFTLPYCFSDVFNINTENSIGFFDFMRYTIIPATLFINHFFVFLNPLHQCYYDVWLNTVVIGNECEITVPKTYKTWMKFIPHIALILIIGLGLIVLNPLGEDNRVDQDQLSEIKRTLTEERNLHFSKFYFTYPKKDPYQKTLKIDCFMTGNEDIASEIYLITEELAPLKDKFNIKKITISIVSDFNLGIYSSWEILKKNEKPMKFDL